MINNTYFHSQAMLFSIVIMVSASANAAPVSDTDRVKMLEQELEKQKVINEQQKDRLETFEDELSALKVSKDKGMKGEREDEPSDRPSDKEPTMGETEFNVYGHVQLDVIYDFKRVDPTWESTLRPSTIPTIDGQYGSDGNTILSIKQTQLGFHSKTPLSMGTIKTWFEFDLFGTGTDAGNTSFNIRHAWVEVGGLGFGQTNSNFMDISIFPNVVDWWGPSGMAFNRNAQLRYTWQLEGKSRFAIALEVPNGSFNTGIFGDLSPEFDANATDKTQLPDLTAHYRHEQDWGHVQLAGVLRKLGFETLGTLDNEPSDDVFGWGLNLTSVLNTTGRDQLKMGLVYGEGIASFMNDGGVNLAPEDNAAEAVPILGVTAYYDRYWSGRWSSSFGFSINDADPRNQQADNEFDTGTYASANLLHTPGPNLLYGAEFLYGKHEDVGGNIGEDYRIQFTFKHKFAAGF